MTPEEKAELAELRKECARLERREADLRARIKKTPPQPRSLTETAKALNMSRSKVRRLELLGLAKLRNAETGLRELLDRTSR